MQTHRCPNCGTTVEPLLNTVRMTTCPSCGSTLFLEGERTRLVGEQGVMHDVPLLVGIGDRVRLGAEDVTLHGHARYSYGRGSWDEFWGLDSTGAPVWLSIDEGDVVLQRALAKPPTRRHAGPLGPGSVLDLAGEAFRVVEEETATCKALRGSFDEALTVGETYRFVSAQSRNGALLSGEFPDGGERWYLGRWYDPFTIAVDHAA